MFWIKLSKKDNTKEYLYLRETIYIRDKRSLIRKPRKLSKINNFSKRYIYSKKKDIYCGKIINKDIKISLSFEDFINKQKNIQDFLKYTLDIEFNDLIDDFISFLLYIYDIKKEVFFLEKKVFRLQIGFFCLNTIDFLKRFRIDKNKKEINEFKRFYNRALDVGIFEEDIISILFSKLSFVFLEETKNFTKIKKIKYTNLKNFIVGN